MGNVIWVVLALVVFAVIALAMKGKTQPEEATSAEKPRAKPPLTQREQSMFFRLSEALPQPAFIVLSQVSFSALLTAKSQGARNGFNRKTADFVVFDSKFTLLAVVELDDASHKGKEAADAARESLLTSAGYKVVRYAQIPSADVVRKDFAVANR